MDPITGVIALSGLTAAALAALRLKKENKEGFESLPVGSGNDSYQAAVSEGKDRYNSFMSMVNPIFNPIIPVDATKSVIDDKQEDVKGALGDILAPYDPKSPEALMLKDIQNRYKVRSDVGGLYDAIRFCRESLQEESNPFTEYQLDQFGNKTSRVVKAGKSKRMNEYQTLKFDEICGVCLTSGVDEEGKPFNGRRGMLVDPDTVKAGLKEQRDYQYPFARVSPSLGKCEGAPNSPAFAIDSETLDLYTKRMNCMKTKEINEKNSCALCYETDTFSYVPERVQKNTITLVLMGTGKCNISVKNISIKSNLVLSEMAATSVPLILNQDNWAFDNATRRWRMERRVSPASEGDPFVIEVTEDPAKQEDVPSIYGYMASSNPNGGSFAMPLNIVVTRDNVSNAAPNRTGGFHMFPENGVEVAKIRPGGAAGRQMSLYGEIPFTFVQPSEFSGIDCPAAPYQTKSSSVSRFATDQPCYAKGSKPGNYNEACLRERILDVGCTNAGDLYKNPKVLNFNKNGNPNTLTAIYNILADVAANDMIDAEKTKMCSGREIQSPCEYFVQRPSLKLERILSGADKKNAAAAGPAKQCLSYIYANKGASEPNPSATYSGLAQYSHDTQRDKKLFCLPSGQLNPDRNNDGLMELARIYDNGFKGSTAADGVKKYLTELLDMAVDQKRNANTDPDRKAAIRKCFGTDLKNLPLPAAITGTPRVLADPPKYIFRHPDGRQWTLFRGTGGTPIINLSSSGGTPVDFDIVARPDAFKASQGRVAIFVEGDPSRALYTNNTIVQPLFVGPFQANNNNYSFLLVRGPNNTVYLAQDHFNGDALIVGTWGSGPQVFNRGDSRINTWSITPFPSNFVKDDPGMIVVPKPTIKFAWYGSEFRIRGREVTNDINNLLNRGEQFVVSSNMYGDPVPGVYKTLWVDFNPPGSTAVKRLTIPEGNRRPLSDFNSSWPDAPKFTPPHELLPADFTPQFNRQIGTAQNNGDYILEMIIRPRGAVGNWGSIVHFTATGGDCCRFGERMPAIWFFPGGLRLHVRIGDANDGNWGYDTGSSCIVGRDNTFRMECRGSNVTIRLNNEFVQLRQPSRRPTGLAQVFAADRFYQAANCDIRGFKFTPLN